MQWLSSEMGPCLSGVKLPSDTLPIHLWAYEQCLASDREYSCKKLDQNSIYVSKLIYTIYVHNMCVQLEAHESTRIMYAIYRTWLLSGPNQQVALEPSMYRKACVNNSICQLRLDLCTRHFPGNMPRWNATKVRLKNIINMNSRWHNVLRSKIEIKINNNDNPTSGRYNF